MLHDETNLPMSTAQERGRDAQPEPKRKGLPTWIASLACRTRSTSRSDTGSGMISGCGCMPETETEGAGERGRKAGIGIPG